MRCAIYTRKSTDEGLKRDFNSLEAQRGAAESFIFSQRDLGWQAVTEHYDDGGYTGGNLERPALRRLLRDIEAGAIDCVVVYKVDRLSRSLLDFARLLTTFDKYSVSLVAVTQPFNTTTSVGRLTLNVLLSFAQFEREMIAERTRDKMAAARRRGKWMGGRPPLGYNVAPEGGRLVINQKDAAKAQTIFSSYLQHRSLNTVFQQIQTESWGDEGPQTCTFTMSRLQRLLRNPIYIGKLACDGELHAGEHEAIVDPAVWRKANELLKQESVKQLRSRPSAGKPLPEPLGSSRIPRVARLLALAWRLEGMLRGGMVNRYAELAELGHVSRSRLTQIVNLLYLAPDIQEEILFLEARTASSICEKALRKICSAPDWSLQRQRWRELMSTPPARR
jgi:DNA invertase Pin-like site-specific DNA recombinase